MIEVLFFGQLTDITHTGSMLCEGYEDTDALVGHLKEKFPALANATYRLAVDNQLVTGGTMLRPGSRVALMPPFSGG